MEGIALATVAVISLVVAAISLGWTVYRDQMRHSKADGRMLEQMQNLNTNVVGLTAVIEKLDSRVDGHDVRFAQHEGRLERLERER